MFVGLCLCVREKIERKKKKKKKEKKEEEANVKGKFTERSEKKKVKCCGCCSDRESINVCLITKMSLETEF